MIFLSTCRNPSDRQHRPAEYDYPKNSEPKPPPYVTCDLILAVAVTFKLRLSSHFHFTEGVNIKASKGHPLSNSQQTKAIIPKKPKYMSAIANSFISKPV